MIFIASIATRSLSSGVFASRRLIHIGLSISEGSKIITSSALSLGINGIRSFTRSP